MRTIPEINPLRILCIAPVFTPTADPEAFCGAKMVQALLKSNVSVTVLSSSNFRDFPKDSSRIWDDFRNITVDVPRPLRPNRLHSTVTAARFQTPFFARWIDATIKTAELLHKTNEFNLVYSRSLPSAAHIAGFWCARRLKLPWVANINDPWDSYYFPVAEDPRPSAFWNHANMFWLRRTLNADLVTYPSHRLHQFHAKLANIDHAAEVISHIGYTSKCISDKPSDRFNLVHAGRLTAADGRFAHALLAGFKAFIEASDNSAATTTLTLIGRGDRETQLLLDKLGLQRNVRVIGPVSYDDSLNYIAAASVCILVEASVGEGIFFPSKLADYVVSRKPVLALSPRRGVAADLANRGELVHVDHEPNAVQKAMSTLYAAFKRGNLTSYRPSDRFVAELQEDAVAEKFLAACRQRVLGSHASRLNLAPAMNNPESIFDQRLAM